MPLVLARRNYVAPGGSAPVWSGSQIDSALVGTSAALDLAALCPTATSFSLQAGSLPAGRSIVGTNITGTYSNGGAVSYTIRATNVSGSTDRAFTGTITEIWDSLAEVDFNLDLNGSASLSIDLDDYATGPTVPPLEYTVRAWPGTISQSGARNNVVSGSVSATQAKTAYDVVATDGYVGGGDNFVAAAAEASAYWTERFPDAASVSSYMLADGTEGRASRQTASPPPGATGFMRFAIPNSDGTNSGNWRRYLKVDQSTIGNGQAYGVRYLYRAPAHALYYPMPGTQFGGPYAGGMKQHIQSWYAGSNQTNEVVIQNTSQRCAPQFYHRNTNGDYLDEAISATGSDYRFHGAVDNGGAESNSAERFLRYGLMYSGGDNIGTPNTSSGSFYYVPDVWMVVQTYLQIGTQGTASTRFRGWFSLLGDPPIKLWDFPSIEISNANGGHNALWLLPYHTARTGGGGQDTQVDYADVCVAPNIMRWPDGTMPA